MKSQLLTAKELDGAILMLYQKLERNWMLKYLQKWSCHLNPSDEDFVVETVIKDGGDGMGDVLIYKEVSDRFLPDKAFRFCFAVLDVL